MIYSDQVSFQKLFFAFILSYKLDLRAVPFFFGQKPSRTKIEWILMFCGMLRNSISLHRVANRHTRMSFYLANRLSGALCITMYQYQWRSQMRRLPHEVQLNELLILSNCWSWISPKHLVHKSTLRRFPWVTETLKSSSSKCLVFFNLESSEWLKKVSPYKVSGCVRKHAAF